MSPAGTSWNTWASPVAPDSLAAGFAVWHWLMLVRHPEWWERRLAPMICYWAVAAVLVLLLMNLHHSYAIMLYGLYPLMFITLGWWAVVPVVGLTTSVVVWILGDRVAGQEIVLSVLATSGMALVLGARGRDRAPERAAPRCPGGTGRDPHPTRGDRPARRGAGGTRAARHDRPSEATVKTHLVHTFAKLGVDDRTAAVTAALERGLLQLNRAGGTVARDSTT